MVGVGVAKGVAIPMFFAISGYLFFYGTEQNGKNAIYRKIYKRVYTLLVPYVLWNIWFALIYLLLHNIPNVSNFINSDIIGTIIQQDVFKNLKMMFWDPCAFHLWFIRNLFIAVLCTPFLQVLKICTLRLCYKCNDGMLLFFRHRACVFCIDVVYTWGISCFA